MSQFSPRLGTSTAERLASSERWRVILYSDSRHEFDDVVFWLESMTNCDTDFAYQICHVCEDQGRAVCYQGSKSSCHEVAAAMRSKGLQVEVDGVFKDVPVKEDHFLINFGEALNYITANSDRVVGAVRHQVTCQKSENPIRKSVVYFGNPALDGMLYQLNSSGDSANQSTVADLFALLEQRLTQYSY